MTQPIDVNIRPVIHPAEYAGEGQEHNGTSSNPYPWKPGHTLGIIALVAGLLLSIGLIGFVFGDTCLTRSCETTVGKKIDANKAIELNRSIERRAIANSDANARAGFGNNDDTTKQSAVASARVISPPSRVVQPSCTNCGQGQPTHLGEAACLRVGGVKYTLEGNFHRCYNARGERLRPDGTVVASR